jgi:hypothetical protein
VKYGTPLFLSDLNQNLNLLDTGLKERKKAQISSAIRIRPVGAQLSHAEGQTDGHDEANSRFSKFRDSA